PVAVADILEGSWPAAAFIAHASVFEIPRSNSFRCQCGAKMASVRQIILGAPVAPMDVHHHRERPLPFRQVEVAELVGISTVAEACVGRRRRRSKDVVFGHESVSYESLIGCQQCRYFDSLA